MSLIKFALENGGRKFNAVSGVLGGKNDVYFELYNNIWLTPIRAEVLGPDGSNVATLPYLRA